jgi:uncharacterized membrane protein YtjA (UPF0391 family)
VAAEAARGIAVIVLLIFVALLVCAVVLRLLGRD